MLIMNSRHFDHYCVLVKQTIQENSHNYHVIRLLQRKTQLNYPQILLGRKIICCIYYQASSYSIMETQEFLASCPCNYYANSTEINR